MLPEIPFHDVGEGGPVELTRREARRARALVREVRRSYGWLSDIPSRPVLGLGDRLAARWFARTDDPFRHEIAAMAGIIGLRGIHALNLSYEWGCTSGVYATPHGPALLRVLDFVFPGLGRHVFAVRQQGTAGTYLNLTWPGVSGVIQASAPGRFAAALNLAPMRRHGYMLAGDWVCNRYRMLRETGLPPAHLLRQVFDTAPDYATAVQRLTHTPVCVPCIYIVAGIRPGEGAVIKRLEQDAQVITLGSGDRVTIANNFLGAFSGEGKGWRPREIDSAGRQAQSEALAPERLEAPDFSWLDYPMRNPMTRLILRTAPADGPVYAQGYEKDGPVTAVTIL